MSHKDQIMCNEIGELFEGHGEMRCEWRISDFTYLPQERTTLYFSPKFHFSNASWCLRLDLNGGTEKQSEGWVGLYLCRIDCGPPKTLSITLGLEKSDYREILWKATEQFSQENNVWGLDKFVQLSTFMYRKSGVRIALCILRNCAYERTEGSLFRRLWNLSASLKNIRNTLKTDVVLKLNDGEVRAHKIILQSRSDVFKRMFDASMRETQTGEVNIEDGNKETFNVVLSYIYSGEPEGLCSQNVYEVYKAAHKYDLKDLLTVCVEFIQKCVTVDTVCDVIELARLYQETRLKKYAKNYFANHKTEVFNTEKWKALKRENPAVGFEVMEYVFGDS